MATLDKIKLSGVTYDIIDSTALHTLDDNVTSGGTNAVKGSGVYDAITAATAALAETVGQELSGKTDVSAFTAHTADTTIHLTSGDVESQISTDIASLFGAVNYDSDTKRINFYHSSTTGTVLAYVDATPFVVDGMIDNVEIKDVELSGETVTCLVITFNTDAGKEEIDIPISDIFDADNYYTKTDTDNAISAATSGKADSSDVETLSGTVTAHTADTTIHVTSSDKTTWSGKQDALVSGTNIKTINGTSILGSGNLEVQSLPTVSGTTLVFS